MRKISFDFCSNMPGLSLVYAIPRSSFVRVRRDHSKNMSYLELTNPEQIIDFYFVDDTAQFRQTGENNAYKTELSLIAPKDHPKNRNAFRDLNSNYWYVLFLDNNNHIRLAGTRENQLRFSSEATTAGRNQVTCTFSGYQDEPALFIQDFGINLL